MAYGCAYHEMMRTITAAQNVRTENESIRRSAGVVDYQYLKRMQALISGVASCPGSICPEKVGVVTSNLTNKTAEMAGSYHWRKTQATMY
jgi:hypothetical protein